VYGLSRDDAGRFLPFYVENKILTEDPFITIDQNGVGAFMKIAVEKGRSVKKDLKMGICGEHGGEPKSVEFCHSIGLDYVSCSPFRVPIARFAAAQATLKEKGSKKPARKAVKKGAKKTVKKVAKKTVRKSVRKVVKKTAKRKSGRRKK